MVNRAAIEDEPGVIGPDSTGERVVRVVPGDIVSGLGAAASKGAQLSADADDAINFDSGRCMANRPPAGSGVSPTSQGSPFPRIMTPTTIPYKDMVTWGTD